MSQSLSPIPTRAECEAMLADLVPCANLDELEVLTRIAYRLIVKGRESYGPLHLDGDKRDMKAEALEEAMDGLVYGTADFIKALRGTTRGHKQ